MMAHARPHHIVTKAFHWVGFAMVAYGLFKGLEDVAQLADAALLRSEVIFAIAMILVFATRWLWVRAFGGGSRLPQTAPRWERRLSKAIHAALYAVVFIIPLSGLAIAAVYTRSGPDAAAMDVLISIHAGGVDIGIGLAVLHVLGALWHLVVRRDGVFEAMTLPGRNLRFASHRVENGNHS